MILGPFGHPGPATPCWQAGPTVVSVLFMMCFLLQFAKLSAELTHANSLGYNGAILQALAVHLALQGELSKETFLEQLISHMEDIEADDKSLTDARA